MRPRSSLPLALPFLVLLAACAEDNTTTAEEARGVDNISDQPTATPEVGPEGSSEPAAPTPESTGGPSKANIEPAPEPASPPAPPDTKPPPGEAKPPPPATMKCAGGEGVREVEGNDTPETATKLDATFTFCGSISGEGDADHFSFVLPVDAKDFAWEAQWSAGDPTFTISSEGVTAGKDDPLAPWFPGKPYVIRLTNKTASDYTLKLRIPR